MRSNISISGSVPSLSLGIAKAKANDNAPRHEFETILYRH